MRKRPLDAGPKSTTDRLVDLSIVPIGERDERLLMIASPYNAYFDESGTHDGAPVIVVGGFVATYDRWARIELEWREILASRGIKKGL